MDTDLLNRKATHFGLWGPGQTAPKLVIGKLQFGAPPFLTEKATLPLNAVGGVHGLWELAPADCGLTDGGVYHYWFEVDDTRPGHAAGARVSVTGPTASTVDWTFTEGDGDQPASVIKFAKGQLVACDPEGTPVTSPAPGDLRKFAQNNFTIAWQRGSAGNPVVVADFSDFQSDNPFNGVSEYVVPNWPRPGDFRWREVSQGRDVPPEWVGREPLFPWEAKVYVHA